METSQTKSNRVWSWGQIMSNVLKKVKKQTITLPYITLHFHILLGDYLLKQEAVVVKPPEWKFTAIIARNTKLGPIFCPIWVKNGKKTDNYQ